MSTFREMVRAQIDELKKGNRASLLTDAVALNILVGSFVFAAVNGEKTQARELLARLVALGSLLADHPDLDASAPEPAPSTAPVFDELTWTLDTWGAELDAITSADTAGRAWVRHRHLFDGREGRPSYEKAWKELRAKLDAGKINPNDVKAWVNDHDEKRGPR